jgi:hypothetical protein
MFFILVLYGFIFLPFCVFVLNFQVRKRGLEIDSLAVKTRVDDCVMFNMTKKKELFIKKRRKKKKRKN